MASAAVQNPPVATESKSARKKKAKQGTESPALATSSTPDKPASLAAGNEPSQEGDSSNPHIREIQKCVPQLWQLAGLLPFRSFLAIY